MRTIVRSTLCSTNTASYETMMLVRVMMLRMRTVMRTIVVASSALPLLPNGTAHLTCISRSLKRKR